MNIRPCGCYKRHPNAIKKSGGKAKIHSYGITVAFESLEQINKEMYSKGKFIRITHALIRITQATQGN